MFDIYICDHFELISWEAWELCLDSHFFPFRCGYTLVTVLGWTLPLSTIGSLCQRSLTESLRSVSKLSAGPLVMSLTNSAFFFKKKKTLIKNFEELRDRLREHSCFCWMSTWSSCGWDGVGWAGSRSWERHPDLSHGWWESHHGRHHCCFIVSLLAGICSQALGLVIDPGHSVWDVGVLTSCL